MKCEASGVLTSKCFRSGEAGRRMGAHEPVYINVILLQLIQEALCKAPLSIVAINYQLSHPQDNSVIDRPTAGESVTSKLTIDSNLDIKACSIMGEVLRSKPVFREAHATACLPLRDECHSEEAYQVLRICQLLSRPKHRSSH